MPTPATAPPSVIDFSCGTTAGIAPCASVASASADVGDHAFGLDDAGGGVDPDHVVEVTRGRSAAAVSARGRGRGSTSASRKPTPRRRRARRRRGEVGARRRARLRRRSVGHSRPPAGGTGTSGSSGSRLPTLPLLTVTWNRLSWTSLPRKTSAHDHRYVRQMRRNRSSKRTRVERVDRAPSCGRSARPSSRASARSGGAGSRRRAPRARSAPSRRAPARGSGSSRPGKMYLRMKNSVSRAPTWPMKWMTPRAPGFIASACARHHLGQLVRSRVLERADRQQLVVLAGHLAEVAFDHAQLVVEAAARDLGAQLRDLLGRRVDPGARARRSAPTRGTCRPPQPQPTSTKVSPGCSRTLRQTWSILLRCASSSVVVPSLQ